MRPQRPSDDLKPKPKPNPSADEAPSIAARLGGRWGDLGVRVVSGLVLAGLGAISVYAGGGLFLGMTLLIFTLMGWELASLTDAPAHAPTRLGIGVLAGLGLAFAQGQGFGLAGLLLAPAAMALTPRREKALLTVYTLALLVAANEFITLDRKSVV